MILTASAQRWRFMDRLRFSTPWPLAAWVVAVVLVLGLTTIATAPSFALAPQGRLTVAASATQIQVGQQVNVTLTLDAAGQPVNVVQADVTYPADKLQLTSITNSGGSFPNVFIDQSSSGLVSQAVYNNLGGPPITGNNLLVFTMHFLALATGSATVATGGRADAVVVNGDTNYGLPVARNGVDMVIGNSPSALDVGRVSPNALGAGASQTATIYGTGYAPGDVLTISGTGVKVAKVSVKNSSQLSAKLTVLAKTSVEGYRDVTVSTPTGTRTCVACLYLDGYGTQMEGVTPANAARGQSIAFHISGVYEAGPDYKVTAGPGVTVTDVQVIGTSDDPNNDLYATLTVAPGAQPGVRTVVVTSLDNFGTVQCKKCLTIS